MFEQRIKSDYFDWMYDLVCDRKFSKDTSYRRLFEHLHSIVFTYRIKGDADRAGDGISLRHRFALRYPECDYARITECLSGPCSILEMILGLAVRCEETIAHDESYGDRMSFWFWKMIVNLGLGSMNDDIYDENEVQDKITKFVMRKYEPNGRGGLFTLKNCNYDVRTLSIWTQMCYFLDDFI